MAGNIIHTKDSGFVVCGTVGTPDLVPYDTTRTTNFYVVKIDKNGDTLWTRSVGIDAVWEIGEHIQQTNDGGYIISGNRETLAQYYNLTSDIYVVKLDSLGNFSSYSFISNVQQQAVKLNIYPNPSAEFITVNTSSLGLHYVITDQLGKTVITDKLNAESTRIDIKNLSKGVYFFKVKGQNNAEYKIIKE